MFNISGLAKLLVGAGVAFGTVVVFSSVGGREDLRDQGAQLLRATASGARWVASKADMLADYIEAQDSEEQAQQQWAKVDAALGDTVS